MMLPGLTGGGWEADLEAQLLSVLPVSGPHFSQLQNGAVPSLETGQPPQLLCQGCDAWFGNSCLQAPGVGGARWAEGTEGQVRQGSGTAPCVADPQVISLS